MPSEQEHPHDRLMTAGEGRLHDSEYVKRLAYQWYEEGAFAEEAARQKQKELVTTVDIKS
jgi:hypothetical protein